MSLPIPDVIFVEDDDALRAGASQALELEGFAVAAFADAASALAAIGTDFPGVVVSDVRMPGLDGIELFARLRERDHDVQFIFTTAHGDVDMAVDAMKNGAADFFTKPYAVSRVAHSIRRAMEKRALIIENRKLRFELEAHLTKGVVGQSTASRRLEAISREVARTDVDLLLHGDAGTGKSHLARHIHDQSSRAGRPFVVVDAGIFVNEEADLLLYGRDPSVALSRSGMIERANGGTLLLESIELIPPRAQARLVSLIDNRNFIALGAERPRPIDLRIIATTGGNAGVFEAADSVTALAHRLGGITIALPPLVDRREDIPEFFRMFVADYEKSFARTAGNVSEAELRHLMTHQWPGNLRELRMFARNFVLGLSDLVAPATNQGSDGTLRSMVASFEKTILIDALSRTGGNVPQVQRDLAVPRKTLYDKFSRLQIKPSDFRE